MFLTNFSGLREIYVMPLVYKAIGNYHRQKITLHMELATQSKEWYHWKPLKVFIR